MQEYRLGVEWILEENDYYRTAQKFWKHNKSEDDQGAE